MIRFNDRLVNYLQCIVRLTNHNLDITRIAKSLQIVFFAIKSDITK